MEYTVFGSVGELRVRGGEEEDLFRNALGIEVMDKGLIFLIVSELISDRVSIKLVEEYGMISAETVAFKLNNRL